MVKLNDILRSVPFTEVRGPTDIGISSLCIDSRDAGQGCLFIARRGTVVDSHSFIADVISRGAVAIMCEEMPEKITEGICYIVVENSDHSLGFLASAFFGHPSRNLYLVGITGTNGKTTVANLLYQLFMGLGYGTGLISTVGNLINGVKIEATHTTPDAITMNALLKQMTDAGCTYCFMEVSSHAIHQHRISGLHFAGGIFTNITHDHLDYHGDFDKYLKAKKAFFDMLPETAFALVNSDDRNAKVMLQNTAALKKTFGLKTAGDFRARVKENLIDGLLLNIDEHEVWCKLIGEFNAANILAAYAAAVLLEQDREKILALISSLDTAEGRFEYVRSENNITAIVDYAHTPDALLNVLTTINAIRTGNEQLITVVGAGGDRDRSKRPLMGRIAAEQSTRLILTSDNPRSEDPGEIIREMKEGVEALDYKKLLVVTSRKEAISTACALANKGDIILVAGKGHEKYQEIKGVKHPFDDKKLLTELLTQL